MFGAYGLSAIKERRSKQISDWMGCKERTIKNKLSYSYRCGKGISDNTNIVSTGDGIYICFRSRYFKHGFVWENSGAMEKRKRNKREIPNIRDFASAEELVVLINLEDTNADLIRQEVPKIERLKILREKAYRQFEILKKNQKTIEAKFD